MSFIVFATCEVNLYAISLAYVLNTLTKPFHVGYCDVTSSIDGIVKVQIICCLFLLRCISQSCVPVMDNSDSPCILEQLSEGPGLVYNTFY